MGISVGKSSREQWYVKNISKGTVFIGDLPKCPPIHPNKTVDLLRHHSKEDINQSSYLKKLVSKKILKTIKTSDSVSIISSSTEVYESVEKNEINEIGEGVIESKKNISQNYSVTENDKNVYVSSSEDSNIVITLPSATGSGRVLTIKKIDETNGTVTISGKGSDTIDGESEQVLIIQYESITMQDAMSEKWYIN